MKKALSLHFFGYNVNVYYSAFLNILFIIPFIKTRLSLVTTLIAMMIVLIVHQLGHLFFVKKFGYEIQSVDFRFAGGQCRHEEALYRNEESIIAAGGVLFQLSLLVISSLLWFTIFYPNFSFGFRFITDAFGVLIGYNLLMVAINLIPRGNLDGNIAWKMLPNMSESLKIRIKYIKLRLNIGTSKPEKTKESERN